MNEKVKWIELDKIKPHPENPRLELDEEMISDIQHGIQKEGFHESRHITVIENKEDYIIIDGHHRYEAAKREELESIPCWIRDDINDEFILMDIENNQNPLSPLERGINMTNFVTKAVNQVDSKNGISQYCKNINKSRQYGSQLYNGAEVFNYIKNNLLTTQVVGLKNKIKHLSEINRLPKECWNNAVEILLEKDWTAIDTQQQIKKAKEGLTTKQIIALLSGKISPNKLKQIYNIKETLINYLENNKDKDNKELTDELIEQWNNYFKAEDPLNINNVRDKREQIESRMEVNYDTSTRINTTRKKKSIYETF